MIAEPAHQLAGARQKLPARLGGVHEVAELLAIDVVPVLLHRVVLSEPVEGVEGDEVVAEGVIEELASMTDLLVNRRRRHYAGLAAFITSASKMITY